jgi:hypothetical protein
MSLELEKGLCKITKEPIEDYKKSPIYEFLEILIIGINYFVFSGPLDLL